MIDKFGRIFSSSMFGKFSFSMKCFICWSLIGRYLHFTYQISGFYVWKIMLLLSRFHFQCQDLRVRICSFPIDMFISDWDKFHVIVAQPSRQTNKNNTNLDQHLQPIWNWTSKFDQSLIKLLWSISNFDQILKSLWNWSSKFDHSLIKLWWSVSKFDQNWVKLWDRP